MAVCTGPSAVGLTDDVALSYYLGVLDVHILLYVEGFLGHQPSLFWILGPEASNTEYTDPLGNIWSAGLCRDPLRSKPLNNAVGSLDSLSLPASMERRMRSQVFRGHGIECSCKRRCRSATFETPHCPSSFHNIPWAARLQRQSHRGKVKPAPGDLALTAGTRGSGEMVSYSLSSSFLGSDRFDP